MNWLHNLSVPILHLDLKPPNILLDNDLNVKIADFGISVFKDIDKIAKSAAIGTPGYMAPELYKSNPPTEKADIYSFGIIIWELLKEESPIPQNFRQNAIGLASHYYKILSTGASIAPVLDSQIADLVTLYNNCTKMTPSERISFSQMREEKLLEKAIYSILGSNSPERWFWQNYLNGVESVNWDEYEQKFIAYFNLPSKAEIRYSIEFLCMKKLLKVKSRDNLVKFENFIEFIDYFGPIIPGKALDKLIYIKKVFKKKWFFGLVSLERAQKSLSKASPRSYLVRKSDSEKGAFTILYVSEKNGKKELVRHRFAAGVDLIIEVETFAKKNKLKQPCPGFPGEDIENEANSKAPSFYLREEKKEEFFDLLSVVNNSNQK